MTTDDNKSMAIKAMSIQANAYEQIGELIGENLIDVVDEMLRIGASQKLVEQSAERDSLLRVSKQVHGSRGEVLKFRRHCVAMARMLRAEIQQLRECE